MPDVFISYSAKDGELARQLAGDLKQYELDVFLIELSLKLGEKWKDRIVSAFREAKWVFFPATPEPGASQPVMRELGSAIMMQRRNHTGLEFIAGLAKDLATLLANL